MTFNREEAWLGIPEKSGVWQPTGDVFEVMFLTVDLYGSFHIRERERSLTTPDPRISELSSKVMGLTEQLRVDGAALTALSTRTAEHRQELAEMRELLSVWLAESKGTPSG